MNKKINYACGLVLLKSMQKVFGKIEQVDIVDNDSNFYLEYQQGDLEQNISISDFNTIEKQMKKLIANGDKIVPTPEDKITNSFWNEVHKKNKDLTIIKAGDGFQAFVNKDVADSFNKVKFFKLLSLGGSQWKSGNQEHETTRIYFVAFDSKDELNEYENFLKEQKERDHRIIGNDLKIFTFDNLVGQGLPIWLHNGEIIKNLLRNFLSSLFVENNFDLVDTPILGNKELYVKSGHWDHYKENNFPPLEIDDETYMLRPMTCPHHIIVYNKTPRSYNNLPYMICENAKLHRYESSGGLIGLERVRAMELFDAHVFCSIDQIENIIFRLNQMMKTVYAKLNFQVDEIHLSLHDDNDFEKYHNDPKMWAKAESQLRKISKNLGYEVKELKGEAAFYGPKIDFQMKTNLGRIITISTIQLDFLLPERFECSYIDKNNEKQRPVLIHFGIVGTYERLMSALLSKTKGVLPFWLMPTQVEIIPVNNQFHLTFSKKLFDQMKSLGFRVIINDSEERLGKKIRESQTSKVPYQIVIGDEEVQEKTISYREYGKTELNKTKLDEFVKIISKRNI